MTFGSAIYYVNFLGFYDIICKRENHSDFNKSELFTKNRPWYLAFKEQVLANSIIF